MGTSAGVGAGVSTSPGFGNVSQSESNNLMSLLGDSALNVHTPACANQHICLVVFSVSPKVAEA